MLLISGSVFALLLSLGATMLVRSAAHRLGMVAAPRKDRWHRKPTAMMGGVAIFFSFMLSYLLFAPKLPSSWPVLLAATLLFVTGLVDDLMQIKPYTKLVVQLVAAAGVVYMGLRLPWTHVEAVDGIITIFWLVGITNALNLLDNMDGLAGGISLISCAFLAITFLVNGQAAEAIVPALAGGAVLGFLFFNFNPASIFMGDCGSMFLGFLLGGMAMQSDYGRTRNLTAVLLTPLLILLIPIFDTCVVTLTRKLSGRPISQGGRDHTSHRLVALGMSERRAVLMLYLFATMSGALAMLVRLLGTEVSLLLIPGFALAIVFLGLYLGKVRVYEDGRPPGGSTIIQVLADFSHKRRVFEVLLDLLLVALAYYGAYLLRFDAEMPSEQFLIFARTLPLMLVVQMLVFLIGGVYRGLWRYTGVGDLILIVKAVLAGGVINAVIVFSIYQMRGPSRAVFVLNMLLLFLFVSATRISFRVLNALIVDQKRRAHPDARPVLIYGAGDGGELLIREILNNRDHRYRPVGFIDDDARKAGKIIHGFRIFSSNDVADLIRRHEIQDVLVSSGKVSENRLESLRGMGIILRRMSIRIE
ncbi:MAG TPA: hypothetical protein VE262_07310 [Blastocatellia bacterium]|nr:hypothetical protein [Blastocatellia bacterium]